MQRHSTRFKRAAGFTLMELLVALVILGMLAGIVGPRIMKYVGGAKSDTAKVLGGNFLRLFDEVVAGAR